MLVRHMAVGSLLIGAVAVSGCTALGPGAGPGDYQRHEDAGTVTGAIIGAGAGILSGAVLGKGNPLAMALGGVIGATGGGFAGRAVAQQDVHRAERAAQEAARRAVDTGTRQTYYTDAQNHGTITPAETVILQDHTPCKRALITSVVQGKVLSADVCLKQRLDGSYEAIPLVNSAQR